MKRSKIPISCKYFSKRDESCERSQIRCMKLSHIKDPLCIYNKPDFRQEKRYSHNSYYIFQDPNAPEIDVSNKSETVYLYKGDLIFSTNQVIDYRLIVGDIIRPYQKYRILVALNLKNNQYYLDYQQFYYHKRKGHALKLHIIISDEGTEDINSIYDFRQFSEISLYGYKVGKTSELTTNDRQQILAYVIDNGILSRWKIISHLQGQIALKSELYDKDYSVSVEQWHNDILFVSQY